MFTGIIQRVGTLRRRHTVGGGTRLEIEAPAWPTPLIHGESIAVQGVCLTVAEFGDGLFAADVLEETLNCTSLGSLRNGSRLNLERALRPVDHMGGHFVSGHVDGRGRLESLSPRGRDTVFRITCEPHLFRYVVPKGSIAIDGVSLTVSALFEPIAFEVNLIPTTLSDTTLSDRKAGDHLNIETDLLGKYVERLLAGGRETATGISVGTLMDAGFPV